MLYIQYIRCTYDDLLFDLPPTIIMTDPEVIALCPDLA